MTPFRDRGATSVSSDQNGGGGDWAAPGSSTPPPGWSTDQPAAGVPPAGWTAGAQTGPWGTPYAAPPPPRPGIIPLRPLGVGELLDGAFAAIRRYPRPTLGLAACVMLVVTVVDVLAQWYLLSGIEAPGPSQTLSRSTDYASRIGTASAIGAIVTVLATLLLTGLITAVIGDAVLGRPVTAADAWRRLRPLLWRLIGVSLLSSLWWFIGSLPGIVVCVIGAVAGSTALFVIGVAVALVGVVYVWATLALAPAALVLETQTVRGALRRSRALVKGSWWRVFGILLLAAVLASVVSGIISLPFGLAGGGLTSLGSRTSGVQFTQLVISGIGSLLASTLVRPFSAGVAALLYIDRRIRAEALDVTLAHAAAETPPG
jgi:hypothetical protein